MLNKCLLNWIYGTLAISSTSKSCSSFPKTSLVPAKGLLLPEGSSFMYLSFSEKYLCSRKSWMTLIFHEDCSWNCLSVWLGHPWWSCIKDWPLNLRILGRMLPQPLVLRLCGTAVGSTLKRCYSLILLPPVLARLSRKLLWLGKGSSLMSLAISFDVSLARANHLIVGYQYLLPLSGTFMFLPDIMT